jgi:PTH1 family peptidyl-tRNA hydrolase
VLIFLRTLTRKKTPLEPNDLRLVVGLGNPGPEYEKTRHNIGFQVVDQLAAFWFVSFQKEKGTQSLTFRSRQGEGTVIGVKPQTFMNLSGQAVQSLMQKYRVKPERVLIVYDDLDIPFGRCRMRARGGPGGHRGMQSICQAIGPDFPRLRVGLGPVPAGIRDLAGFVLAPLSAGERKSLPDYLGAAVKVILCWLEQGIDPAMNRCNAHTP